MVNSVTLLIEGAKVVTPYGIREGASLLVEGERIRRVFDSSANEDARGDKILRLENHTLLPGFIDIHTHGAVGVDVMTATPDDLLKVGRHLAAHGVTSWLPTLVPAPPEDYLRAALAVEQLVSRQSGSEIPAARALGLHYEGPFVNEQQCGALRANFFRTFKSAAGLDTLPVPNFAGARHMMTLAPEVEGGVPLVRELMRRGWVVSLGHTRAPVEILDQALAAGARHMTHFFNAMPRLHQRAPGPVGWGLAHPEVSCDVIADGAHVDPLVLKLLLRVKGGEHITLISDSVAPAGLGDGQFQLWGETIKVLNGRTENERGHLAGSVINIGDAVRLLLRLGVSFEDIALMAARNPARLLGIEDDCGTIEEGKRADLVALDKDHSVSLTIIGGIIRECSSAAVMNEKD